MSHVQYKLRSGWDVQYKLRSGWDVQYMVRSGWNVQYKLRSVWDLYISCTAVCLEYLDVINFPPLKIYKFGEAKVINLFNAASIYIIYHTNKFLINTTEGLGSLISSLLLRQSELYRLHTLDFCIIMAVAVLFCLSNYYTINQVVHFIV